MATDNNYLKEQYNVMSQFCDLTELQSSSDENETPNPHAPKHKNKKINNINTNTKVTKPTKIIHPTIPKNNNSQFDLSQFCDLTQLESSDEDAPPTQTLSKPPKPPKTSKHSKPKPPPKKSQHSQAKKIKKPPVKKINTLPSTSEHKINKISETKSNDPLTDELEHICPFRKLLMFAMHLHLTGCIFPQWMVNVLGLFNDSNLTGCHEGASLGKNQRKLFRDTVCNCNEPDNFIFVDTRKSIEMDTKTLKYCSWAIVNVSKENVKYCDLLSINGHKLNINIDKVGHLMINKGVYLFFNRQYQSNFLNFFLYSKEKENMFYFCREYKQQQKEHIAKILKLDYGVSGKYSTWFLSIYDRYLSHFDVNDCYELLAANIPFWKDLILNKEAMKIQFAVDHTFVVKTMNHSKWMADTERDYCSYKKCSIKFGVVNRKHHCRCCGDIFCKLHCEKQLFRRNDKLESGAQKSATKQSLTTDSYNQRDDGMAEIAMLVDGDLHKDEREFRICPTCKTRKYLFVDMHHKHKFMECQCLKWNVKQIDFEKQWKIFKSTIDYDI